MPKLKIKYRVVKYFRDDWQGEWYYDTEEEAIKAKRENNYAAMYSPQTRYEYEGAIEIEEEEE